MYLLKTFSRCSQTNFTEWFQKRRKVRSKFRFESIPQRSILKCKSESQVLLWKAKDIKTNFFKTEIRMLQRVCQRIENIRARAKERQTLLKGNNSIQNLVQKVCK